MNRELLLISLKWLHNQRNGAIAFIVLSTLFVTLRCVGVGLVNWKRRQAKPIALEDALVWASLVAFLPLCACAIVDAEAYLAYYSATNSGEERRHLVTLYKAVYGLSIAYPVACALPKLSICCMYVAIFKVRAPLRRMAYVTSAFIIVNAVAWLLPSIVVCLPPSGYWDFKPHKTKCLNYNMLGTWISLPQIFTDIILLILPLPYIWNLQMKLVKKISLTFTFLVASVGLISGCLRFAFYIHRTYFARPGASQTTRSIAIDVIVTYVECGMYLIAACLPRMASLVNELHTNINKLREYLRKRRQSTNSATAALAHAPDGQPRIPDKNEVVGIGVQMSGNGNLSLVEEDGEEA